MPTYEYLCKQCGERFEKVQSFSARPLKTHDACGGEVQKVFHASGVVFKGPGFYATDNRSRPSGDTKSDSTSSKTESKSETKPASKSESKSTTGAAAAAD